jgi:hypothetical protein
MFKYYDPPQEYIFTTTFLVKMSKNKKGIIEKDFSKKGWMVTVQKKMNAPDVQLSENSIKY